MFGPQYVNSLKVLLVRLSSLGDVVHSLPAITDLQAACPEVTLHWVVEEAFTEIPSWHPFVQRVIPIALRRWRRHPWQGVSQGEIRAFWQALRAETYDYIIDIQGLIKSGLVSLLAKGRRCGFDRCSARDGNASIFYQQQYAIDYNIHVAERGRFLLSQVMGYEKPQSPANYGLDTSRLPQVSTEKKYVLFFHGSAWQTKCWPEAYWRELATWCCTQGLQVKLPWGNSEEYERAQRIAKTHQDIAVLPAMSLAELAALIAHSQAVVSVDTGLGHLAGAFNRPQLMLWGATDPYRLKPAGERSHALVADFPCAPCGSRHCTYKGETDVFPACFTTVGPQNVIEQLQRMMME